MPEPGSLTSRPLPRLLCRSSSALFVQPLSAAAGPCPNDLAACRIIDWWAVAFVAVTLPLALLRRMEQGRRRPQLQRGNEQQLGAEQVGHGTNEALQIFLYSVVIWHVTAQLGPLLWRTLPGP